MPFARLFRPGLVLKDEFAQWAGGTPGVDPIHHYHALTACAPFAARGARKILDIGPDSYPWLATLARFCGHHHELWSARQGGIGGESNVPPTNTANIRVLPAEFDVWSPLGNREAPHAVAETGFTLVTALHVADRMYHPDTLFRVIAEIMAPRGVLVLTAKNVARFSNVLGLLRGGGVAGDLNALIGKHGTDQPRPRVREYCWQELNGAALLAGLSPVAHRFYDDPATGPIAVEFDAPLRKAIRPFVREAGQLQSEMILIFRKTGPVSVRLHRVRQGIYPLLREARAKAKGVQRRLKYRR